MANKALFQSVSGSLIPAADSFNEAGGKAYRFKAKHALAQYALTGSLSTTFYANAETQLQQVLRLCALVKPEFIAKTAVYARQQGYMKDMPALLTAWLAASGSEHLAVVFKQVVDNSRMLRNFVQILRSGVLGRKSLGSAPKKLVQQWLNERTAEQLLAASVGQAPSLADIIKLTHPKPESKEREALYAYFIGKPCDVALLPASLQQLQAFKAGQCEQLPDLPMALLTPLNLQAKHWLAIARQAPWQTTRMNLNSFARHGVFEHKAMALMIAERISDAKLIHKAKVFPYQLLSAYKMCSDPIPGVVHEALRRAMQIALDNVPKVAGKVFVLLDVSGSMQSPLSGYRRGATGAVRCVDVAALLAAAVMAKNTSAEVLPFDTKVHRASLHAKDGVLHNAQKLAHYGGGGTDCSKPLQVLNERKAKGDVVIYVSDNESWADRQHGFGRGTATMQQWEIFRRRNGQAKLICIDIQPYASSQARERCDVLNIGGFSDIVFAVIADFASDKLGPEHWLEKIEAISLR